MITDVKQITTAQEVFDYVANHLITQGKAAVNSKGTCVYRAKDGSSCAVGCLIPDDEYNKRWENKDIYGLMQGRYKKGRTFLNRVRPHLELLARLQTIHDHHLRQYPDKVRGELTELAEKHNLKVNFQ